MDVSRRIVLHFPPNITEQPVVYRLVKDFGLTFNILKKWIEKGEFSLTEPVAPLPGVESGITFKPLKERPIS